MSCSLAKQVPMLITDIDFHFGDVTRFFVFYSTNPRPTFYNKSDILMILPISTYFLPKFDHFI